MNLAKIDYPDGSHWARIHCTRLPLRLPWKLGSRSWYPKSFGYTVVELILFTHLHQVFYFVELFIVDIMYSFDFWHFVLWCNRSLLLFAWYSNCCFSHQLSTMYIYPFLCKYLTLPYILKNSKCKIFCARIKKQKGKKHNKTWFHKQVYEI